MFRMKHSVTELQARLIELGLLPGLPDGIIGPLTKHAVCIFQGKHALAMDGIVGPLTEAALWPEVMPKRDVHVVGDAPGGPWPRQNDVPVFYGRPGQNQKMLDVPFDMHLSWDAHTPVRRFSVHEKVHDSAGRALARIAETYSASERARLGLDAFGGCLNVRAMRGGSRLSMHSWGIAIDFDPDRNPLRPADLKACPLMTADAAPFWQAWEAEGWVSLGRAAGYDPMHVQAARL